ncbi:MAG: hypothetical protein ACRCZF_13435 [Gemmataceae bacterium]
MSTNVVFRVVARLEFDEAGDWYEARRPGLGATFTAAVQVVLDRIAAQPDFYAVTEGGDVQRFVVANMTVLLLGVGAVAAVTVAVDWDWWAVGLTTIGAFLGGGQVVERFTPGTRLLLWLGLSR